MLPNPSQLGTVTPVRSVLCVEPSLKQNWLCGSLFVFSKVAQTHAHEPIALLWTKVDSFSQLEDDARQFFARGRRRSRRLAAGGDFEFAGLRLRNNGRSTPDSLPETNPTFSSTPPVIGPGYAN